MLSGTVFLVLDGTLVGSSEPVFDLRKLMTMLSFERASFRREFLEIKGIERHHTGHAVRISPKKAGFREMQYSSSDGVIYRRKNGASSIERKNLQTPWNDAGMS
jgi:hypothetical protein